MLLPGGSLATLESLDSAVWKSMQLSQKRFLLLGSIPQGQPSLSMEKEKGFLIPGRPGAGAYPSLI